MSDLIAYGAYVPHHRLERSAIRAALGTGGGRGTRAVASYDEDATSMGVEAGRHAVRGLATSAMPEQLLLATTAPPYLDKTNANAVHAALDLPRSTSTVDVVGSVRSAVGALVLAAESPRSTMAVLADVRTGLPGGADESGGGDGAAAFVFGDAGPPVATVVAHASATGEFLERWRLPGAPASRVWEERFGEHVYGPLADQAFADACGQAGIGPADVDVLAATGTHARAVRSFARRAGVATVADDLTGAIGNPGAAQPGLVLADVLDRAEPEQVIALVVLADGATVVILRVGPAGGITSARRSPTVAEQIGRGDATLAYATFLSWRGLLPREPPRRPDPVGPAAPPSHRAARYKYALVGHRCVAPTGAADGEGDGVCGTIHLPAVRVCVACKAVDRMEPVPMADAPGTVVSYTVDHLAFSPHPPVVAAVVDLDGGGRISCDLTDVDPARVAVGDRVEMTFRKVVTGEGIHNYFWKARPVAPGGRAESSEV